MLIIPLETCNPYFNIAAEEYLLKNFNKDICLLYCNEKSIICGKHQNTLAEINYQYIKQNKIPVIRRLSGGGTVFHDRGNLNFSFIMNGETGKLVDFKKFTISIISALEKLGLKPHLGKRNEILIDNKKISGNAEHVYKNRTLHHGTLLFSSNLNALSIALKINPLTYKSKAVKSVRSRVTNIAENLIHEISFEEFTNRIYKQIKNDFKDSEDYFLKTYDIAAIEKLKNEKYQTWDWNFAYSPEYKFRRNFYVDKHYFSVSLTVKNGIIKSVVIENSSVSEKTINTISGILENQTHRESYLNTLFSEVFINEFNLKNFIEELF